MWKKESNNDNEEIIKKMKIMKITNNENVENEMAYEINVMKNTISMAIIDNMAK